VDGWTLAGHRERAVALLGQLERVDLICAQPTVYVRQMTLAAN